MNAKLYLGSAETIKTHINVVVQLHILYVKPLWRVTENILGVDISFERMLGSDVCFVHNAIVTLIGFLIYKEWLLYY